MADLLNENPELQRQFAAAAAAKMGGGFGNFMSAASGFGPGSGPGSGPNPMARPPAPMGFVPPPSPPRAAANTRVPFNVAAAAMDEVPQVQPPRARREMRGPTGVDDILKAFEAERMQQSVPVASQHSTVFTPSGPPPTPPRSVNIVREGVGSSSDPLAEFALGASDSQSVGTESTMNTERRRGRRRAAAAPVGATLNLNV